MLNVKSDGRTALRLAGMLAAVVLALGLLAGCSGSDEAAETGTGSDEVAEEAAETETEADAGSEEADAEAEAEADAEAAAEAEAEAEAEAAAEEVPDLSGDWEQSNKNSEESYMVGSIEGDVITIYWHFIEDDGSESDSLYWVGSFKAPESTEAYSWDSENDHEQTDDALLASTSDTKTFSYEDGILSFEVTAMGSTTTVQMEQL